MRIDILVLNYNGKDLLTRFLPSIIEAAGASRHHCQVTVVDNKSIDGSGDLVKDRFPSVSYWIAKENRVLFSYNDIVKTLDSDIVILLNNDIKLERDFVNHLVDHFKNEKVFFVAPKILNFDGSFNGGRSRLEFRFGIIKSITENDKSDIAGNTSFISCGAFKRSVFIELGGFDDLYLPGIWEDVDLCYRALKCGFKGIYEPRSVMWHNESTTFNKVYGFKKKMAIAHRNMFLFLWKNITDKKMMAAHIIMILPLLLLKFATMRTEFVSGFFQALSKIDCLVKSRKSMLIPANGYIVKDSQLIGKATL